MELESLNKENLLSLLDWMDFDGIIYMAESNETFNKLIIDTYITGKFGFHEKPVHITNAEPSTAGVRIESNGIWINGFAQTLRILQNFGHLISRLELNSHTFDSDQVKIIGYNINEHCAPSLREFILNDGIASPFAHWYNTFERCEAIEFRHLAQHNTNFEMHRIFPNLHRLYIHTTEYSELNFIEHKFAHLQQVTCDFSNASLASISRFKQFLLLNEQITALEVISPIDVTFLKAVAMSSANLQSLTITIHPLDFASGQLNDDLHFATVKMVKLRVIGGDIMFSHFPVIFDGMQSLELACSELDKYAIKMIKQYTHLNRLVIDGDTLDYTLWMSIIDALPELIEITAQVRETFLDAKKVDKNALMMHTHLQRITIKLGMFTERKVWIDIMPKQWQLIESEVERELRFVRAMNDVDGAKDDETKHDEN